MRMAKNLGGAGGFYEGMKAAFEGGFDWIWVMDDDAEPECEALYELERHFDTSTALAVASLLCDADGATNFSSHRGAFVSFGDFLRYLLKGKLIVPIQIVAVSADQVRQQRVEIDHASFVGACYSREAVEIIGFPKKEFFIHYDDFEYNKRLKKIGKMTMISASKIRHKEANKTTFEVRSALGWQRGRQKFGALWIKYYSVRNAAWLLRQERPIFGTFLGFCMVSKLMFDVLLFDTEKKRRLRFLSSAYLDSLTGTFDNDKPKILLYG